MTKANVTSATIRPQEAAHFAALARRWWDPHGPMASLHQANPVRLAFLREAIKRHWDCSPDEVKPLEGKRALDVGCGAGLLCEPLARLGARVTGLDASSEVIAAAREHASQSGLEIDYRVGELAALEPGPYDLVTAMEVIEHVADKPAFLAALAERLDEGALAILSTPNRTAKSRLLLVEAAERLGVVPRGTHDWNDFVTPEELRALLEEAGLCMGEPRGIAWSPTRGLHLSDDCSLDYIVTVTRAP